MAQGTGFFFDEKCFWHSGGNYALTLPVGDLVQPLAAGGLPESPETKRRLKNLMDVTGLSAELHLRSAPAATDAMLARVHPSDFLEKFKSVSDAGGGEIGLRTPFGKGGYEIAALSAGLATEAVRAVATGDLQNAYALSRPPGHHCLPDWPNGFCLLANIAIAIEEAKAQGLLQKVVVLDWDVHHGNGTEAIFYDRDDVLTISMHQEHNYPLDSGDITDRGRDAGLGANINIPLPPGAGHNTYLYAMEQIVLPALKAYQPDMIIVACGFDASAFDPLSRMLASADTFRQMTKQIMRAAENLCDGKLVLVHEGGYSEAYVPFCGHAVIEELASSDIRAEDPMAAALAKRQPNARVEAFFATLVDEMAKTFASPPG
ncbi:class II histone deacetylase [Shimia marina]|uniref:Histone deacetylase-like amidohydrolase n=2 Tax=Shimia TaxID=573139 RepID=A0A0N7LSB4_9RHOB|nr:class II histone deacetylase [Shimia marina]CUH53148.1 Histone deacetylase-like amidohydrolase [Shimia marina]SFD83571.1 Acetoin utilization deacetylase AcuC [Shimia marina]